MAAKITISSEAVDKCDYNPDTEESLAARAEWLIAMATKMSIESVPRLTDAQWQAVLNHAIAVKMFPAKINSIAALEKAVDDVRDADPSLKELPVPAAMGVVEVLRTWWCEYTSIYNGQLNDFAHFKRVVENITCR